MHALFEGGRIVDLILALMALEAVVLGLLHRRTGTGIPLGRLWPNLMAGACLVLALRASLTGAGTAVMASWLALGLAGHFVDLVLRWSRGPART